MSAWKHEPRSDSSHIGQGWKGTAAGELSTLAKHCQGRDCLAQREELIPNREDTMRLLQDTATPSPEQVLYRRLTV